MASKNKPAVPRALERRLLSDIAEIQQDPYPNVHLHFDDANIRKACLILAPQNEEPLHLTIDFHDNYPLRAPVIKIQTKVVHPNVFGDYICATMLNAGDWTSAYTLKGVVIQLLSFFTSDRLEQDYGNETINLAECREEAADWRRWDNDIADTIAPFQCEACGFGPDWKTEEDDEMDIDQPLAAPSDLAPTNNTNLAPRQRQQRSKFYSLPDEVFLLIFALLDTRDILSFGDAIPAIKAMVNSYDFDRTRELQCFCLKQSFLDCKLGIGVSVTGGRRPVFRSEFDLLSQDAFFQHKVRDSIQGVRFDKWLLLPLSRRHWNKARTQASACLKGLHEYADMQTAEPGHVDVLYHFMNTIVVQFSTDAERSFHGPDARSTLSHASEKAVEA